MPHRPDAPLRRLSVIIPVLNETATIGPTLRALRSQTGGEDLQIIVVDGDPCGATLARVRDPAILRISGPTGRARQMNCGARRAGGDTLLFLHADTHLPFRGVEAIHRSIERHRADFGAFDLGIADPRPQFRLIETMVKFRSRLFRMAYGDQAIFIRRDFFDKLDGYREIPIMEDIDLMRRARRCGGRFVLVPQKVCTSARRWRQEGVLFCTLRNWILATLYLAGVSPERLQGYYGPLRRCRRGGDHPTTPATRCCTSKNLRNSS